jgi:hypothetical protein
LAPFQILPNQYVEAEGKRTGEVIEISASPTPHASRKLPGKLILDTKPFRLVLSIEAEHAICYSV